MFASGFVIPANAPNHHVVMQCCYDGPQPLSAVAFRVHTHALGRLVYLERGHEATAALQPQLLEPGNGAGDNNPSLVLRRSPLLPQAFSLVSEQPRLSNPGTEEGGGDSYVNFALPGPLFVRPGQLLRATCRFNASGVDHPVTAGSTHNDEARNVLRAVRDIAHTDS
jgi:peptidylamidoglycolate lyase